MKPLEKYSIGIISLLVTPVVWIVMGQAGFVLYLIALLFAFTLSHLYKLKSIPADQLDAMAVASSFGLIPYLLILPFAFTLIYHGLR